MKNTIYALLIVALYLPASGFAALISWTDPAGDHSGGIDIVGMDFNFASSGDYTIDLFADGANPFVGDFRININLFNVTLNELFADSLNDFSLAAPQTSVTLTGNSFVITDWLADDLVATSTYDGYGNPHGARFFKSSVADLPFQPNCVAEDIIGLNGCGEVEVSASEPLSLFLLASGLASLGFCGRKKPAV